jgi:EamA domain-containing membrane protein RarD
VIQTAQLVVFLALYLLVFIVCVVALVDLTRRPAQAFVSAGKRTKNFWLLVLGLATAVAFVAIPWPVGIGQLSFLALGSAVAGLVYLVDVKPAVAPYSGGRSTGSGRGGW